MGRTRIAPTPSGYLHVGNCLNFLVIANAAQAHDLEIVLRLDVDDRPRIRQEYIDDVDRVLEVLDITVHRRFAPDVTHRWDQMWEHLMHAHTQGLGLYACDCSRRQRALGGICTCPPDTPLDRLHNIKLDAESSGLPPHMHGITLWRRDGAPSSTMASLFDDEQQQITHVIRGADLSDVSAVQRHLAPWIAPAFFPNAVIWHHLLLTNEHGHKHSKSAGARATPLDLDTDTVTRLKEMAREIAAGLPTGTAMAAGVKGISGPSAGLMHGTDPATNP